VSTERITTDQAVAWARSRGAVPHVVDGSALHSTDEALAAIGDALDFPPWYGRNLDALYDCLTDLSWLPPGLHVLVWSHHQTLAEHDWPAYQKVRHALLDGAAAGRRLTVMLTAS
jgi:RNAse (barnase) inhibitor barstar